MATKATAAQSETQEIPADQTPVEQTSQDTEKVEGPEIYPPYTFGPDNGGDVVIDSWRGLFHVFGARIARFDVTLDGVYAVDVTMAPGFNPKDVIADMGGGKRHPRLDLVPLHFYAMGQDPLPFEGDAASVELTRWLTTNFRSEDNGGRSPQYAKDAIAGLKKAHGLEKPRGRKPKKLLEQITTLTPELMAGLDLDNLAKLREVIARAEAIREHQPVK